MDRPHPLRWLTALLAACALVTVLLPMDWSALRSVDGLRRAAGRLLDYLRAFAAPDLSAATLARAGDLALDTVAIALLGTALGLLLAVPLALGSCRVVVQGDCGPGGCGIARRVIPAVCRLILDVLRAIPDFVWALVIATVLGTSSITGVAAIAVGVAGILGKVLGEQWEQVPARPRDAVRAAGAGRLAAFVYGIQPLGARPTLSFLLMRTECAVRNASVIGVVGGGGLGAGLWDEYIDRNLPGVTTMLLTLLLVTASADLIANHIRRTLRVDPHHPRTTGAMDRRGTARRRAGILILVAGLMAFAVLRLMGEGAQVVADLARIDFTFVRSYAADLVVPATDADLWGSVLKACLVPLGIALLATVGGSVLATLLVLPASLAFQVDATRFTGERVPAATGLWRLTCLVLARATAVVLRGVPEVGWVTVLAVLLHAGTLPCAVAITLHSAGVLHRVFTEAVDDIPFKRLTPVAAGASRAQQFLYGAVPRVLPVWRTYALFQFEVNLRAGVALGIVGAGGLGDLFARNLRYGEHARAAAFLWAMLGLTILVDRLSRRVQERSWRRGC